MNTKIIAIVFAVLASVSNAQAFALIQRINMQPPGWVNHNTYPSVDEDFANGRYWIYGGGYTSPYTLNSITRASASTDLLPTSPSGYSYHTYSNNTLTLSPGFGVDIFETRTNQLFNSAAPVTQTTGSLATGTYTLWVNGSGSATMSLGTGVGCGVATASQGVPVNFTITVAGTCIVTVSGSLNAFQLELGVFGTSLIVTAGATGARAADNDILQSLILSTLKGTSGQVFLIFGGTSSTLFPVTLSGTGSVDLLEVQNSNTGLQFNGATSNIATFGSGTWAGTVKSITSWTPAGRNLVINNGTEVTSATTIYNGATPASFIFGSLAGTSRFYDGPVARATFWTTPSSGRKALTQ